MLELFTATFHYLIAIIFSGLLHKNQNLRLQYAVCDETEIFEHDFFNCTTFHDIIEKNIRPELKIKYMFDEIFSYIVDI